MNGPDFDDDPAIDAVMARAADDYLDRVGRGERPTPADFAQLYPQVAGVLPELLPALGLMRGWGGPSTVGPYRLVREVGRGGMGVVFEAIRRADGLRVALKLMPEAAADPGRRARFRVEAQTAMLLDHPRIVPILDVGEDRGIPYLAMRYIDGCTLADVIAGDIRPTADRCRQAALVGVEAAEALEHAHRRGVLHRDVKPANLLIDREGRAWVADFGLAQLVDGDGPTRTGDLLGTPRYASPEQLAGDFAAVDRRADVYSLGVSLYELVTRTAVVPPHRVGTSRRSPSVEPARPRRVDPLVPRDLESILLRSMAREPGRRYRSAGAMAEDFRRYLEGRPILARCDTWAERAGDSLRRNRPAVVAVAGTLVLAASIGVALLVGENRRTAAALDPARTARARERATLRLTFAATDQVASRALARLAPGGSIADPEDRSLAEWALEHYADVAGRHRGDPEMAQIVAAAMHRVGFLAMMLGRDRAVDDLKESTRIYESIQGSLDADGRADAASAFDDLASVEGRRGDLASAELASRRAVARRRMIAERASGSPRERTSMVMTEARRVGWLADLGRVVEADTAALRLLGDLDELMRIDPTASAARNRVAWCLSAVDGLPGEARRRALAHAEALPATAAYRNTLGAARMAAGDGPGAIEAIGESIRLGGGDAYDRVVLALAYLSIGRGPEAAAELSRADEWIGQRRPTDDDLRRLRSRAGGAVPRQPNPR